jgi:putative SOS response-associated peptidase YedK
MENDRPFAIAGLWDRWYDDAGKPLDSCTIITTSPNAALAPIHDRMPVILDPDDYTAWLNPETSPTDVMALMKPPAPTGMVVYEVDRMGSPSPVATLRGLFW